MQGYVSGLDKPGPECYDNSRRALSQDGQPSQIDIALTMLTARATGQSARIWGGEEHHQKGDGNAHHEPQDFHPESVSHQQPPPPMKDFAGVQTVGQPPIM